MSSAGSANTGGKSPGPQGPGSPADEFDPDFLEALRQVSHAGSASYGAFKDAGKAFRSLLAADVSLARSAMGRSMALVGLAVAFGASAWLLLMASAILFLRVHVGLSWIVSMLLCAGFSLLVTVLSAWLAARYFDYTRLKATRRQLARLGIGELSSFTPAADSARSARDATEDNAMERPDGEPIKDKRGIPVTPP